MISSSFVESKQLTFQVTWKCDIRCSHCFQSHKSPTLDEEAAKKFLNACYQTRFVDRIAFTGGEAFLRLDVVKKVAGYAYARWKLPFGIVTNARWATSQDAADSAVKSLKRIGLDHVTVSYDHFHQKWVSPEYAKHVFRAAEREGIQCSLYSVFCNNDDKKLNDVLTKVFESEFSIQAAPRMLIPVPGTDAEKNKPDMTPYENLGLACPSTGTVATVWPDGSLLPCCTAGTHERLKIGNIVRDDHHRLTDRIKNKSVASQIKRWGINVLNNGLSAEKKYCIKSKGYVSSCHLCHSLMEMHDKDSLGDVLQSDLSSSILAG